MTSSGSDDELTMDDPNESEALDNGTITPDPFLAKVARVPPRGDGPTRVPQSGEVFGRFEVRSELGRGGMGIVYAAVDPTLGREVALKVLPASGDSERRRRFLREARSAAAVSHPGIATVYEVGEQDGTVFIAMERVRGKTLRAWMDEHRPAPIVDAQRIARQVARTLAKAHEQGVVHRDLKPENAMITEEGEVKLLDFGLAKLMGSKQAENGPTTETQEGRVMGTPCYMSPEQARGLAVDTRSDVFSFGVMLYELLTGRRPFTAANSADLMAAITRDDPVPVTKIEPRVSAEMAAIVDKCLRKAPADRYADARELSRDLDEVNAEAPVHSGQTLAKSSRKRSGLSWKIGAAVVGLSALVALGLSWKSSVPPAPAAPSPPTPVVQSSVAGTIEDLPVSPTVRADAVAAYRRALSNFRHGMPSGADIQRAIEIDPNMAAAHAQIAAGHTFGGSTQLAREHYRKAMPGALSEQDRLLLGAIEPLLLRQPSDWAESIRRLSKAVERFPKDIRYLYYLAIATANFEDFGKANQHLEKIFELDPQFVPARYLLALYTAYQGRFDDAERAAERCLELFPDATMCMDLIAKLRLRDGSCEAMAGVARRMIAAETTRVYGELVLAESLAARGQPLTTVEQAINQAEENRLKIPSGDAKAIKIQYVVKRMLARMLAGDFETAQNQAREVEAFFHTSHEQEERGIAAKALAQILLETGKSREAADVAIDYLDRREAWEPNPSAEDFAMARDATPFLLLTTAEADRLPAAERTKRRDAWLRDWEARATPIARNFLWMHAYGVTAFSADDAKNAIAALPRYSPLPPYHPETLADAYVGRMYLLANRTNEAIHWLQQASRSCAALQFPFDHTRAHLWLGQAKEATGDTKGACTAYNVVLARWGQAKPKSVSADQARARVKALGCPA